MNHISITITPKRLFFDRIPVGFWLLCSLVAGLTGCAGIPQLGPTANTVPALMTTAPPSTAAPAAAITATTPASAALITPPGSTPAATHTTNAPAIVPLTPTIVATAGDATPGPVQGLQHELALADQQMNAVSASATLPEAQQHAQAVVNILGGAWGRWYGDTQFSDASDRRGIFPGDRIPGPANDTSTDLTPFGWGIRAYDLQDANTQLAVQTIMGDVKAWRDSPRAAYDMIQGVVNATDPSHPAIAKLAGRGTRALAWARLIVVSAGSLDQARQYAVSGSVETDAAVAAAETLK
jgi:hypothetical protein